MAGVVIKNALTKALWPGIKALYEGVYGETYISVKEILADKCFTCENYINKHACDTCRQGLSAAHKLNYQLATPEELVKRYGSDKALQVLVAIQRK